MTDPHRTLTFRLAPMSPKLSLLTWTYGITSVAVVTLVTLLAPAEHAAWMALLLGGMFFGVLVMTWGYYRPRRFEVSADGLRIVWPWRSARIAAGDLKEVRATLPEEVGLGMRVFGVGGIFGRFGRYRSHGYGPLEAYITGDTGWVMIKRYAQRPLLLTLEDYGGFVRALDRAIRHVEV